MKCWEPRPVPLQLPIGLKMISKALWTYQNEGHHLAYGDGSMTFDEIPVPEDMLEEANEWRGKLVEAVAEYDEKLLEKFFEDPNSITEDECMKLSVRLQLT